MPVENFSALLGRLSPPEKDSDLEPGGPVFRVSSNVALVVCSLTAGRTVNIIRSGGYYDEMTEEAPSAPPISLQELKGLVEKATSIEELRRLRRNFARQSHPDRLKAAENSAATSDMAAANKLIDEAISLIRRGR